jgi:hypothetical protein
MTMEVLQDKLQISKARQELKNKGVSLVEPSWQSLIRKLGFMRMAAVGDMVKSWDVLATLNFIQGHIQKDEPVFDIT